MIIIKYSTDKTKDRIRHHIDNNRLLESLDFGLGSNAVCNTEATGLMPAIAENEYQLNAYLQINDYRQAPIADNAEH